MLTLFLFYNYVFWIQNSCRLNFYFIFKWCYFLLVSFFSLSFFKLCRLWISPWWNVNQHEHLRSCCAKTWEIMREFRVTIISPSYGNHNLVIRYSHFDWAQITGLTHGLAQIDIRFFFNWTLIHRRLSRLQLPWLPLPATLACYRKCCNSLSLSLSLCEISTLSLLSFLENPLKSSDNTKLAFTPNKPLSKRLESRKLNWTLPFRPWRFVIFALISFVTFVHSRLIYCSFFSPSELIVFACGFYVVK